MKTELLRVFTGVSGLMTTELKVAISNKYDKFGLRKSGTKLLKCYEVELKKLKER